MKTELEFVSLAYQAELKKEKAQRSYFEVEMKKTLVTEKVIKVRAIQAKTELRSSWKAFRDLKERIPTIEEEAW